MTTTLDDWRDDAACRDAPDPDRWHPTGRWNTGTEALRVCVACPVRDDCLDDALAAGPAADHGVWGGTSEEARRQIRLGVITRDEAKARGDHQADLRTHDEVLAEDEPWLEVAS